MGDLDRFGSFRVCVCQLCLHQHTSTLMDRGRGASGIGLVFAQVDDNSDKQYGLSDSWRFALCS